MLDSFIAYYRERSAPKPGFPSLDAQREAVRLAIECEPVMAFTEAEARRRGARPMLDEALEACRAQRATLAVATMDGLSRDQHFLRALVDAKVLVAFCDIPVPTGAGGRFMLQMMAQVAELESQLASRRTKAGHRARIEREGPWDRNARHHLVPGAGQAAAARAVKAQADDRAAELAAILWRMANRGMTLAAMAAELEALKVPTARGGRWTPTAVKRLLERLG
ncbi:MAG: recombinase family protein [Sphingomonadales bacterium]